MRTIKKIIKLLEQQYIFLHQRYLEKIRKNEELSDMISFLKGDVEELELKVDHLKDKVIRMKKSPGGVKALSDYVYLKRKEEYGFTIISAKDIDIPVMDGEYDSI